jgi:5-methylcytosine-specific restriction endonuclease McrA
MSLELKPMPISTETVIWSYDCRPKISTLLYVFQEGKCSKCMKRFTMEQLTVDHIKPVAQGGVNNISNKQLLCRKCHREKTVTDTADTITLRVVKKYSSMTN